MIVASSYKDKKVALFGLGGSGLVTAKSLIEGGAQLSAWDDNPDQVKKASDNGIPVANLKDINWQDMDYLALAPGVPLTHPKPHWTVHLAHESDTPIIGDVEIFANELAQSNAECPFIAITGTNGKSTTTALISHIISHSGRNVQMGGNIGTAVLSLEPPTDGNFYVVECSSYQIDLAPSLKPSAGILLNLSADHLDRHGTMAHYASVKEQLVAQSERAIVGVDDQWCKDIHERLVTDGKSPVALSVNHNLDVGVFLEGSVLKKSEGGQIIELFNLDGIATLRGQHNAQNAAAAIAACLEVGVSLDDITKALPSFPGLKHRMQPIAKLGDITFVNDSKATNADATYPALSSYKNIVWILGGQPKDGGILSLKPLFSNISKAFLIGDAAPSFAAELGGLVDYEISENLVNAVDHATEFAMTCSAPDSEAPTVLFSPACASFDQFKNFEVRGDKFVELVLKIDGIESFLTKPQGDDK